MSDAAAYLSVEALEELEQKASAELGAVVDDQSAEAYRIKYLGKKGLFREILKGLKDVSPDNRRAVGGKANELRAAMEGRFGRAPWRGAQSSGGSGFFDYSLPGFALPKGSLHPPMSIRRDFVDIFAAMGFDVAYGPEMESDWVNF